MCAVFLDNLELNFLKPSYVEIVTILILTVWSNIKKHVMCCKKTKVKFSAIGAEMTVIISI